MIILLPAGTTYKTGNNFPLMTIPMDMPDSQSASFEDFQWWALSSDFQKWLKKNPRKWVAESNDLSKYEGSVTEYLKENFEFLNDSYLNINESEVLSFDDFSNSSTLFEAGKGDADSGEYKEAIKFHFAYNKLKSEGKILNSMTAEDIKKGDDKAVFLLLEDPSNGENMLETLKAYRMTGYVDVDGKSKIRLIEVSEMLPGGPIGEDENVDDLIGKIVQDAAIIAAAGGVGVILFGALKIAGGALGARALLKTIQGFRPNAGTGTGAAGGATSLLKKIKSGGIKSIKSLWGGAKEIITLKNTRSLLTRGFKGAKASYTLGKTGVSGAIKAFGKGFGRGTAQLGSKAIPFVGEVLIVIDAVGSIWNWYSDNQAPRYGEVDSFASNEMDPSKLPIGVPITVCWSQPAGGGWGTAVSFLFNNETRTTAELIKIADKNGESIFIMTQVNSKEIQKSLANHELTLISLDNSDIVNDQASSQDGILSKIGTAIQRTFDNEDLDFKISHIDGLKDLAAMFNFQGICEWSDFESAYQAAGDQLMIVDPNAPEEYEFYYKDGDENVVNVTGRLISNDELKNATPEEFENIFYSEVPPGGETNKKNEGFDTDFIAYDLVNEASVITSFGDFNQRLYEDKDVDAKKDKSTMKLNPEQASSAAEVAVYVVTEKEFADPESRKYKVSEIFRNFIVDPKDYKAKVNSLIDVETNTVNEEIEEPRRGVFVFKKETPKPKEEEKIKQDTEALTDDDIKKDKVDQDGEKAKDDYYITVDPKDVQIKDKKSSTVIRDNNFAGGINLVDKFLTDKDKEIMNIANWKAISYAKASLDTRGDVIEVKIKNKFAPFGDKIRKFKVSDGEAFEIAKKFASEVEDRIKYQ